MSELEEYNFLKKYPQLKDLEGKAFLNAKDFKSSKDDKEIYNKIDRDEEIQKYIDSVSISEEEFSKILKKPKSKYGICVGEQHGGDKSHIIEMIPYLARKGIPFFTEGLGMFEVNQKDVDEYLSGAKGQEWIEKMNNNIKEEFKSDPIQYSAILWDLKYLQECKKYGCKFYLTSTYVSHSNAEKTLAEGKDEVKTSINLNRRMQLYNKPAADIIERLAPKDKNNNSKFLLNTGARHTFPNFKFTLKNGGCRSELIPGINHILGSNRIGFQKEIDNTFSMFPTTQKGDDFYIDGEKLTISSMIDGADAFLNMYQDPKKWKENKMLQTAFYAHDFEKKGNEIWMDDQKKVIVKNDKIKTEEDLKSTLSTIITKTCNQMNIEREELLKIGNKAWICNGVGNSDDYKRDSSYDRDTKISAYFQQCCKEHNLYSPVDGTTPLRLKRLLQLYSEEEIQKFISKHGDKYNKINKDDMNEDNLFSSVSTEHSI